MVPSWVYANGNSEGMGGGSLEEGVVKNIIREILEKGRKGTRESGGGN